MEENTYEKNRLNSKIINLDCNKGSRKFYYFFRSNSSKKIAVIRDIKSAKNARRNSQYPNEERNEKIIISGKSL